MPIIYNSFLIIFFCQTIGSVSKIVAIVISNSAHIILIKIFNLLISYLYIYIFYILRDSLFVDKFLF